MKNDLGRVRTLALGLLRRVGPRQNREAMIGDLLEQVAEGRSAAWFWREILSALMVGLPCREVTLALLGPVLPILVSRPPYPLALWRWPNPFVDGFSPSGFGWPLGAVMDCSLRVIILALLVMIELTLVGALQGTLSWASARRWVLIVVPVMAAGLFLTLEMDGRLGRLLERTLAEVPFYVAMLGALLSRGRVRLSTPGAKGVA